MISKNYLIHFRKYSNEKNILDEASYAVSESTIDLALAKFRSQKKDEKIFEITEIKLLDINHISEEDIKKANNQ